MKNHFEPIFFHQPLQYKMDPYSKEQFAFKQISWSKKEVWIKVLMNLQLKISNESHGLLYSKHENSVLWEPPWWFKSNNYKKLNTTHMPPIMVKKQGHPVSFNREIYNIQIKQRNTKNKKMMQTKQGSSSAIHAAIKASPVKCHQSNMLPQVQTRLPVFPS